MRVRFSGSCTVERMEELVSSMNEAVARADNRVEIDLNLVTEVDLAFFQLLHGARRSLDVLGKSLICAAPLPSHLAHKAALCGFSKLCPDSDSGGHGCDVSASRQAPDGRGGSA